MKKRLKPIPVSAQVYIEKKGRSSGILMEILLLFIGLAGYLFCNTTALDMNIHPIIVLIIAAIAFGLMILVVWYKRVFFGIFGGAAVLSLIAWKISFPFFSFLWRALEVCYNYTVHLLASQPNYSNYRDHMTMDITDILKMPIVLQRYFYTALIVLALIASVFFALALFRRIPPIVSFLVPAVGLIPFFFYGIVPHFVAFSVFLSALIGCYGQSLIHRMIKVEQKKRKKDKKEFRKKYTTTERLAFASRNGNSGVVVMAIMLVVTMGITPFIYSRPIVQMEKVRQSIDMLAEDMMNLIFAETYEKNLNVAGYLGEDEALSLEMPRWRRLKVAKVYSTTDVPIYLRFRTTMAITEEGWTVADDNYQKMLSSQLDTGFYEYTQYYEYLKLTAPSGDPKKAKLDHVDSEVEGYVNDTIKVNPQYVANNFLGIPSGAADTTPSGKYSDLELIADTSIMYNKMPYDRSYSFTVTSPLVTSDEFLGKFQKNQDAYLQLRSENSDRDFYLNNEQIYSGLVKNNYTALPNQLRIMVWDQARQLTSKYEDKIEKVQAIERYFRENYTYSMERHRLTLEDGTPANAFDQIQYFLNQNEEKSGYCTLFSSSMTAMLRSIGIPARVVAGYYVKPQMVDLDNYSAQVLDNNYHSWVEVYFDGAGWLAFDPTPSFGVERNYVLLDLADQGLESVYADEEVEVEFEEIEGVILYSDILPEPTMPEEEEENRPTLFPILNQPNAWLTLLMYIGLILLLMAVVVFGIFYLHNRQLKKIRTLPYAEGVQAGYYIILRLMQMRGFKFFEGELLESFAQRVDNLELSPLPMKPIVSLLQKGLFGTEEITVEERDAVAEFVEALDQKFFRRIDPFRAVWFALTLSKKPRHKNMIWKFE